VLTGHVLAKPGFRHPSCAYAAAGAAPERPEDQEVHAAALAGRRWHPVRLAGRRHGVSSSCGWNVDSGGVEMMRIAVVVAAFALTLSGTTAAVARAPDGAARPPRPRSPRGRSRCARPP